MSHFELNHCALTGNLTRDPELRSTAGGKSVCQIRIAVNDRTKNAAGEWVDRPNFFDVTIWEGIGENVARQCSKGSKIIIEGKLRWSEWEAEGGKRQKVDIVAFKAIPIARNPQQEGGGGQQRPAPAAAPAGAPWAGPAGYEEKGIDDDIPF